MPPPAVLGVLGRATAWRPGQVSAIMTSIDAETRVVMQCLPTGAGKTLIYITEAILNGGKVVILTSTKGQQDQILESIAPLIEQGVVVDVRGQMNYRCEAARVGGEFEYLNPKDEWLSVAEGPCQDGEVCSLKDGGCVYYDRIRKAKRPPAQIVVTNYAFWMTNPMMEPRFRIDETGPVDLLVCDEAHEAVNEVCDFMMTEIRVSDKVLIETEMNMRLPPTSATISEWVAWAYLIRQWIDKRLEGRMVSESNSRIKKKLRKLGNKVEKMVWMTEDNWVVDSPFNAEGTRDKILLRFDPIWPRQYAESMLFRGAKKIVMSSATIRKKSATLLGIEELDVTMFEAPSQFRAEM